MLYTEHFYFYNLKYNVMFTMICKILNYTSVTIPNIEVAEYSPKTSEEEGDEHNIFDVEHNLSKHMVFV